MADGSKQSTPLEDQWHLLYALSEMLIENGIIDPEDLDHAIVKWSKSMGVELKDAPLTLLKPKSARTAKTITPPEETESTKETRSLDETDLTKTIGLPPPAGTPQKKSKPSLEATKKTVMIADPIKPSRKMLRATLEVNGYKIVAEANKGLQTVRFYTEHKPDIILIDIEMNGMEGLDALRQIRSFDPHVPVILMTGDIESDYLKEALKDREEDYLTKPVDIDRLLSLLSAAGND